MIIFYLKNKNYFYIIKQIKIDKNILIRIIINIWLSLKKFIYINILFDKNYFIFFILIFKNLIK